MSYFKDYFKRISKNLGEVDIRLLGEAADILAGVKRADKKVIIAGNGASAAIASHISVDMTKNAGVRTVNFNDADLITCFSNDYGYEMWVAKALEFYAEEGDAVILISSSGRSANMINAAKKARQLNLPVLTLTGFKHDNPLSSMGAVNIWIDSEEYNIVEAVHGILLSAIGDKIS
ncbi:SIS domain-containing protein [bacterium]|nr:SIS domain-containing protein [Candidatus Omnitrophota bacterium]MBU3929157.1 SIS domain-containing protein [bacterium]MBU4122441.1 SIS domain-containing protein [bacterium]